MILLTKTMREKKQTNFNSPDVSKLQAVVIDEKTIFYIPLDADPEETRKRYLAKVNNKNKIII